MIFLHAYTHGGPRFIILSKGLLWSLHRIWLEKFQGGCKNLACNSHPSIQWPCLIMFNFGFRHNSPGLGVSLYCEVWPPPMKTLLPVMFNKHAAWSNENKKSVVGSAGLHSKVTARKCKCWYSLSHSQSHWFDELAAILSTTQGDLMRFVNMYKTWKMEWKLQALKELWVSTVLLLHMQESREMTSGANKSVDKGESHYYWLAS